MEPTAFEDEQTAFLPPHDLVTYAKDQPEYRPLPVVKLHGKEGRVISRWTFTDEERAKIAEGADLFIEMLTFGMPLQPILPSIDIRDMCPADPIVDTAGALGQSYIDTDGQKAIAPSAEDVEKMRAVADEFRKNIQQMPPLDPMKRFDPLQKY